MQVDRFRFDVDVEVDVLVCDLGINNLSRTAPGSADFSTGEWRGRVSFSLLYPTVARVSF